MSFTLSRSTAAFLAAVYGNVLQTLVWKLGSRDLGKFVHMGVILWSSQLLLARSPAQGDEILRIFHLVPLSFGSLALLPTGRTSVWKSSHWCKRVYWRKGRRKYTAGHSAIVGESHCSPAALGCHHLFSLALQTPSQWLNSLGLYLTSKLQHPLLCLLLSSPSTEEGAA